MNPTSLRPVAIAGLLSAAMGSVLPAAAMDTPSPAAVQPADPLKPGRDAIARQQWDRAITELRKVNAKDSADWHNLMGFALRKRAQPDLPGAQTHYDSALGLDPNHKGALEYAGELALMKADLPRAEAYLTRLVRLCPSGCEERADLERAVARFKAEGKR